MYSICFKSIIKINWFINIGFESYCDHYIISSINKSKETNINVSINFSYAFKTNRIHIKLSLNESFIITQHLIHTLQYYSNPIFTGKKTILNCHAHCKPNE